MRRTRLHRKGIVSSVVVAMTAVLALALSAGAAGAAGDLDQTHGSPRDSFLEVGSAKPEFNRDFAQTFTAGITGDLDQVDLHLGHDDAFSHGPLTAPLTVQLRNVVGSVPGDTVLATAVVQPESIPSEPFPADQFGWIPVPIGPVPVTAGTQYAIVLPAGSNTETGAYLWGVSLGNAYPEGRPFASLNGQGTWTELDEVLAPIDTLFRTYVTPTPPPPPPPQQQCRVIRLSIGLGLGPPIVICL